MHFLKNIVDNRYIILIRQIIPNIRYYIEESRIIKKTEFLSAEELNKFQVKRIKELLIYARKNVPYYRELFKKTGFNPEDFKNIEDIRKIPYLTKDIIRKSMNDLVSTNVAKRNLKYTITGGTTGRMPLDFYLDKRKSSTIELAYLRYFWNRVGYRLYDRCIVLRGEILDNIIEGKKYWRFNHVVNWLTMSSFNLNNNNYEIYLNKINKFRPRFIIAYPSVIYTIAKFYKSSNMPVPGSLKAIICSSETLYDWQREFINSVFKVRTYSFYGLSEKCCIAGECENSAHYEFAPQYGFVELVNRKNQWCKEEDEEGEIVATGLNSHVFPFIRYRTEDVGIYTRQQSNNKRNWFTIKKVQGRIQEFFVDKFNSGITFTCSDEMFWKVFDKVSAYQYVQDKPGIVVLNIEVKESLTSDELSDIKKEFNSYFPNIELTLKIVDNIPKTRSGKFRYLIQNLPLNIPG